MPLTQIPPEISEVSFRMLKFPQKFSGVFILTR